MLYGVKGGARHRVGVPGRQEGYADMVRHALVVGANAVVGMRYNASEVVSQGSALEVLCSGTAVVEPIP
jgi:uncharacterized protein YbjQ (UPF0145 family)